MIKEAGQAAVREVQRTARGVERVGKAIWSLLDAASEKQRPSEYLSERGKQAMQGKEQ